MLLRKVQQCKSAVLLHKHMELSGQERSTAFKQREIWAFPGWFHDVGMCFPFPGMLGKLQSGDSSTDDILPISVSIKSWQGPPRDEKRGMLCSSLLMAFARFSHFLFICQKSQVLNGHNQSVGNYAAREEEKKTHKQQ